MKQLLLVPLLAAFVLSGCSQSYPRNTAADAAVGGVTGTVVGAGGGAIVGATVPGISAAEGALVGGGAGLGIGLLAGAAYSAYDESQAYKENAEIIRQNEAAIIARQREIEYARERVTAENRGISPNRDLGRRQYIGPSLGNPFR